MNKRYLVGMALVALIGGMIGGAVAGRFLAQRTALASSARVEVVSEVRAKKLILVDEDDKKRAALEIFPMRDMVFRGETAFLSDNMPALVLYDEDEKRRAAFSQFTNGRSGLSFFDDREDLLYRLTLSDYRKKEPIIVIEGKDGQIQAALVLEGDNKPGLSILDKDGNKIWNNQLEPMRAQ